MPKIIEYSDELTHYGRLGMKWGQHIFKDSDRGSGKKRQKITIERTTDYTQGTRSNYDPYRYASGGYRYEEGSWHTRRAEKQIEVNGAALDALEKELYEEIVEDPENERYRIRMKERGLERLIDLAGNWLNSLFTKKKTLSNGINTVTLTKQGKLSETAEKGANWVASLLGKGKDISDTVSKTTIIKTQKRWSNETNEQVDSNVSSKDDYEKSRRKRRRKGG